LQVPPRRASIAARLWYLNKFHPAAAMKLRSLLIAILALTFGPVSAAPAATPAPPMVF